MPVAVLEFVVEFPSVERKVSESTELWARDLQSLFEHAKDRFGDVSWESEDVENGDKIWGHKGLTPLSVTMKVY